MEILSLRVLCLVSIHCRLLHFYSLFHFETQCIPFCLHLFYIHVLLISQFIYIYRKPSSVVSEIRLLLYKFNYKLNLFNLYKSREVQLDKKVVLFITISNQFLENEVSFPFIQESFTHSLKYSLKKYKLFPFL